MRNNIRREEKFMTHVNTQKMMRMILNGKEAANLALREAVSQIRERGYSVEVRVTWEAGDAARFASEAIEDGLGTIIAAGGDGTINDVVNGLMKTDEHPDISLGIVPLGTANDFATGCGIPTDNLLDALRLAAEGDAQRLDVGKVNDRFFINVASGGFGAEVTTKTPKDMKKILGGMAYSLTGLVMAVSMTPYRGKLSVPGEATKYGELVYLAVGNGRQAGGGLQVAPQAYLNDGLLDVLGIRYVEPREFGVLMTELMHVGDEHNRYVFSRRLSSFTLHTMDWMQFNLDGEPLQGTTFEFDTLPQCLPVILPPDSPVLRP
jgi:lipid kinase YegS